MWFGAVDVAACCGWKAAARISTCWSKWLRGATPLRSAAPPRLGSVPTLFPNRCQSHVASRRGLATSYLPETSQGVDERLGPRHFRRPIRPGCHVMRPHAQHSAKSRRGVALLATLRAVFFLVPLFAQSCASCQGLTHPLRSHILWRQHLERPVFAVWTLQGICVQVKIE